MKLETRHAIKSAARCRLERDGFRKTTVRSIASDAGVAPGSVIVHFGSKEALFYEAFYDDIEQVVKELLKSAPSESPLTDQLCDIGETFLNHYSSRSELYTEFLECSLLARGDWGQRFEKQVEDFGKHIAFLFRAAMERGELRSDLDLRTEVATFLSFYYFMLLQQIKGRFGQPQAGLAFLRTLVSNHVERLQP